jgi:hypothetical protein
MGGGGATGRDGRGRFGPPSPATVISLVALFVALSGTALALQRGEVKSKHIAADAVKAKHVAGNAISGAAVNEASLGQVPEAASADALAGLDLAEVTGQADQAFSDTGSLDLTSDCDIVGTVTRTVSLTRPARILVFASGFWEDAGANSVEAVVELRDGSTTVATSPRFASELDGQPNTRYDVVAVLRNGTDPEIPAGDYTLRVVLDSNPCQPGDGSSQGGARLGYVTIGAR